MYSCRWLICSVWGDRLISCSCSKGREKRLIYSLLKHQGQLPSPRAVRGACWKVSCCWIPLIVISFYDTHLLYLCFGILTKAKNKINYAYLQTPFGMFYFIDLFIYLTKTLFDPLMTFLRIGLSKFDLFPEICLLQVQ